MAPEILKEFSVFHGAERLPSAAQIKFCFSMKQREGKKTGKVEKVKKKCVKVCKKWKNELYVSYL